MILSAVSESIKNIKETAMLLRDQKNNVIYYESSEKLETPWINENSTRHTFVDGKGEIELKKSVKKM